MINYNLKKEVIKMDMYQKRKMRAEKKNNGSQESFPSVGINWFPGHMAKTRKQIAEDLKMIDIVVEILDARIPMSSQNPAIFCMYSSITFCICLTVSFTPFFGS